MRSRLPHGLLVSVRTAVEAEEAVAGGTAIVDVKEPSRGPLGRADAVVTAEVLRVVNGRTACTLACGELAEGSAAILAHVRDVADALGRGNALPLAVKTGPAGLDLAAWQNAFAAMAMALPPTIEAVAVAYADADVCGAPDPGSLAGAAAACGATALLIDTCDKSGPGLFERHPPARVADWVARAHAAGLLVALAGRLTLDAAALAIACRADVVGVRSAACEGGRLGRVDRGHVGLLVGTLTRPVQGERPAPDRPRERTR